MKRLFEHSVRKSCRRPTKQNPELEKHLREKVIDCTPNKTAMITHSIATLT